MNKELNPLLTDLNEKLLAGKASLEPKEILELFENIKIEMGRYAKVIDPSSKLDYELWQSIFNGLLNNGFANSFISDMDKELFFSFGNHLLLQTKIIHNELNPVIHNYLNLFRYSSFLQKIYDDRKWDKLIYDLIVQSNYTFDALFNQRVNQYKKKNLFRIIKGNKTIDYSWQKTSEIVSVYRSSIKQILFEIGSENQFVAFLLENSLEMAMLDIACLTSGIVNAMIPANSVSEHLLFILNQTKAPLLFADDEKQLAKIRAIKKETTYLKTVILLKGNAAEDWVINFEEFKALASTHSISGSEEIKPDSLATLMYTSGTTGEPKGIMFSHTNIVYKRFCRAMAIPEIGDDDRYLAFLPLYHTFGRWLEMTGAIFWGAEYCFMENPSVETMIENMRLVKPSIFISIPKKWIQLYEFITARIDIEIDEDEKIKEAVAIATGGKLKWGLSAAGFLPPDVFRFFQRYGIELMSGFGMTEATGGITMTPPFQYRENSLGKALPGIEIRIGEDGEILIRGPYVMINYYNQNLGETFDKDGWLATGDIMLMDKDGFIQIIDRKKEIYKNIKGETVAPQKIENLFRDFEFIKQVFLVGDHKPFNTVLIFPDYESENSPLKSMDEQQRQEYFSTVIVSVNNFLAPFERIVDFRIIDRPFSDVHQELTLKGTFKRRVIENNFDDIIKGMYQRDHLSLPVENYEIKIPTWFLRERGSLSSDVNLKNNLLSIPKLKVSLNIKELNPEQNIVRIGNYAYKFSKKQIDLQDIITNPFYWLGNIEIVDFTGDGIFRWYRKTDEVKELSFIKSISLATITDTIKISLSEAIPAYEFSIQAIHYATVLLQSQNKDDNDLAIRFFSELLRDSKAFHYKLSLEIAYRTVLMNNISVQRKMFLAALQSCKNESFQRLLKTYIETDFTFLDKEIMGAIDNVSRGDENLVEIENVLSEQLIDITPNSNLSKTPIKSLFELLVNCGVNHPLSYEQIRKYFLLLELQGVTREICSLAQRSRIELRQHFILWLGKNHRVAIDAETGEEYRWDDVLIFDQAISEQEQEHIKKAISEKQIIREAIFLFSGSILISLNNILPSGVWISKFSESENRHIFRVTVQTRFHGGFDFTIHLFSSESPESIEEEIKWKIITGTEVKGEKLAAKFGGLWEGFKLWTEEFVGEDSVEKFIRREYKKNDELVYEKLRNLWKFFVWNAAAAYVSFWKLTNMKTILADVNPNGIIVSPHDYQTGCIITDFTNRKNFDTTLTFFVSFYESFIVKTEETYPLIKKASVWNAIFSGIIEVQGIEAGLRLLNKFRKELTESDLAIKTNVVTRIDSFIRNLKSHGFLPKPLYFSIKRFHRWYQLNNNASLAAQSEMLYELYETYHLFDLEEEYPAARTRFFLETVFYNSSQRFKEVLRELVRKQRNRKISKEESLRLISSLHFEFELDEKETYFITRLGYPHLKPSDSAALLKIKSELSEQPNLVVQLQDDDGNIYTIRKPINPKEISKLHQLYLDANLSVNFKPEHQYLVAVSERGFIIGGVFYYQSDEETVHMEKIVVSNRYRRKGISEGLMNELFNRIRSEKVKHITTGFFRPEYFYRFGFKIERKYSGLVKELN